MFLYSHLYFPLYFVFTLVGQFFSGQALSKVSLGSKNLDWHIECCFSWESYAIILIHVTFTRSDNVSNYDLMITSSLFLFILFTHARRLSITFSHSLSFHQNISWEHFFSIASFCMTHSPLSFLDYQRWSARAFMNNQVTIINDLKIINLSELRRVLMAANGVNASCLYFFFIAMMTTPCHFIVSLLSRQVHPVNEDIIHYFTNPSSF